MIKIILDSDKSAFYNDKWKAGLEVFIVETNIRGKIKTRTFETLEAAVSYFKSLADDGLLPTLTFINDLPEYCSDRTD